MHDWAQYEMGVESFYKISRDSSISNAMNATPVYGMLMQTIANWATRGIYAGITAFDEVYD